MKWLNIILIVIWVCLLGYGVYSAWQSFENAQTLVRSEIVQTSDGVTMYDDWGLANYSHWMFVLYLIPALFLMPWWWQSLIMAVTLGIVGIVMMNCHPDHNI